MTISACGDSTPPAVTSNCTDPPRGPPISWFDDVTASSGVDFHYDATDVTGGALAVADLDGDGRPDIVAGRQVGGLAMFRNYGSLQFEAVTDSGLDPTLAISAIAAVDLDNDGDIDLVLAGQGTAYVMANQGDGTFVQVAVLTDSGITQHVLAVDLDGDGLLDLYFSNHDLGNAANTNRLYMNRGGLQFAFGGAIGAGQAWSATALDVDGDGDQDLYVANDTLLADFGPDFSETELPAGSVDLLLRNDGPGPDGIPIFTDIAADMGLAQPRSSMGGTLADFNDDGLLDIYIPNLGAKKVFSRDPGPQLRVRGDGVVDTGYVDDAPALGLAAINRIVPECTPPRTEACLLLAWSAAVSDFDLDGYDELLVVNGVSVTPAPPPPVQLFTRGPSLPYTEVAPNIACMDARGLVVTDLDGDGDQDIVIGQQEGPLVIYEDHGTPSPTVWLRVMLHGHASNREGIGAVVTMTMASGRTQIRAIGAGGVLNTSSPAEAFFGLGSDAVATLNVLWPSGRQTEMTGPLTGSVVLEEGP